MTNLKYAIRAVFAMVILAFGIFTVSFSWFRIHTHRPYLL